MRQAGRVIEIIAIALGACLAAVAVQGLRDAWSLSSKLFGSVARSYDRRFPSYARVLRDRRIQNFYWAFALLFATGLVALGVLGLAGLLGRR